MWRLSFKRTLEAFTHLPLETALWQGAGFWIGVESSTIFASLPIDRLGYGELSASGVIALVVIIVVVLLLVLVQAWQARKFGMLQYYLVRYIWLAPILLVLAFIPDYTLRLHHYLYAVAAIPVLSLPNRVSLFGQAFALGLFLDGTGRWGWDSILEYTASVSDDTMTRSCPWLSRSGCHVQETFTPRTASSPIQSCFTLRCRLPPPLHHVHHPHHSRHRSEEEVLARVEGFSPSNDVFSLSSARCKKLSLRMYTSDTAQLLGDAFAGTGTPLFLKDNSTASIISWFPLAGFDLDSGYQGVAMVVDDVLRVVNATSSSESCHGFALSGA
jgi:hypothetical protein